jgi:putative SOS response-associated peptidase YedK
VCGRFTLRAPPEEIAEHFGLEEVPELVPRFNIAPGQEIATIFVAEPERSSALQLRRWGLIPSWAKDERIGNRQINARVESAAQKPAFRNALRHRRCLVPGDGFYEWSGAASSKQPHHIGLEGGALFAFAGLWERWRNPAGRVIESCTILTTEANRVLGELHSRMPVIVDPERYGLWLDPDVSDPERLKPVVEGALADALRFYPVSLHVNDARRDDSHCLDVADVQSTLFES